MIENDNDPHAGRGDADSPRPESGGRRLASGAAVRVTSTSSNWLRSSRLGTVVVAIVVGTFAGFGAVGFRWLIFGVTWIATGHEEFGQAGRVGSAHLPWLGIWFLLVIPVVGGLLYGPLIQRFAREARGHGVPEVMIAVAEDGGHIRPQVTGVKALASALCIGAGGSVGREGPIVQIGSAFASSVGQVVRMSEGRMRILVACGAAGGISATFNAPITGVFFAFELILREFSIDALLPIIVSSVLADVVGQAFFGSGPIFSQVPHHLVLPHDVDYLLVVLLGLMAAGVGVGFKSVLYRVEDLCDRVWGGRPEWCRPAVGGVILGALLLVLPQLYGVGYPVMDKAVAGQYVLWFLLFLMVGKVVAASLTIGIGGSGGVFAPSLFTGAMAGTAFGVVATHVFGPAVGSPAIYGVIAMGAVFAAAAQAPLTAIASVTEMTGNFTLTLPIMLAVGLAAGLSKRMTYGTIYTTKLLRRGTDIERPRPSSMLQMLTVADVMQPLVSLNGIGRLRPCGHEAGLSAIEWTPRHGEIVERQRPQALFADETLEGALRQLVLFGPAGLPVISGDRRSVTGWVTNQDVVGAMSDRIDRSRAEAAQARLAAEFAAPDAAVRVHVPSLPLDGYELVEVRLTGDASQDGGSLDDVQLPPGSIPAAVTKGRHTVVLGSDTTLHAGDRLLVLMPVSQGDAPTGDDT
jgi:chloride channel protein, CIC family